MAATEDELVKDEEDDVASARTSLGKTECDLHYCSGQPTSTFLTYGCGRSSDIEHAHILMNAGTIPNYFNVSKTSR